MKVVKKKREKSEKKISLKNAKQTLQKMMTTRTRRGLG